MLNKFRDSTEFKFNNVMDNVDIEMQYPLSVILETLEEEFQKKAEDMEHKERRKITKSFNKRKVIIQDLTDKIYTSEVALKQLNTQIRYLLSMAINNCSYKELAKMFATYDFHSKKIKKECKQVNDDMVKEFLENCKEPLDMNIFQEFMETVNELKEKLLVWIPKNRNYFIEYDIEKYTEIDFELLKSTYKKTMKDLNEIEKNK